MPVQITIPAPVTTWLRGTADTERPELTRELRLQIVSLGSEHHPARITAITSLWHDIADPETDHVRSTCLCDAEGANLSVALERLGQVLLVGS